jgi:hypothetical protein
LKQLNDLGAFVSEELVPKEIKFKLTDDGDEHVAQIMVRRLSIGHYEAMWGDVKENTSKTARMLCESVRLGEDGAEKMTYEQAYQLHAKIALAMSEAVAAVNGGERKN